jgi:hypothetical protein
MFIGCVMSVICAAEDNDFGRNNAGIVTQTEVQVVNKNEAQIDFPKSVGIATQSVVQDSKGGEIRVVTTIRDTSWPSSIVYSPMSYYELVPQFYRDKISVREVTLGKLDYFFSLFCSAIPRQWHPASDKCTLWHLDLFDAMTIGVQDANVAIVQACLAQIPYSKSILSSGKSTDFISNQAVTINGKFKIDQFIDITCDSMATRINKARVTKWLATGTIAASGVCAYKGVSCLGIIGKTFNATLEDTVKPGEYDGAKGTPWLSYVVMGTGAVATVLAHRLQHIYVDGYIKVLDLLVSAEGVTFDRKVAYEKIKALKEKVQWFGLSSTDGDRLQAVLNKLC